MNIEQILNNAKKKREAKGIQTDMERILSLPQTPESLSSFSFVEWTERLRKHPDAPALLVLQGLALQVASMLAAPKGLVVAYGVGHGKTLISFLLAAVWGCLSPVLLIPPSLKQQCRKDLEEWSKHYRFPIPHIITYSELSSPTRGNILETLQPDCIIADEAHCLRHPSAARTKRFIRYMQRHPRTRFAALSGTLTSRSLADYGHLCELALRGGSPLPLDARTLEIWSSVLDPDGEPDRRANRALLPMVAWSGKHIKEEGVYRKAFQKRFRNTLGVVASKEGSIGCSLIMEEWDGYQHPKIKKHLADLSDDWQLPNGEYLADALSFMRAARQLSLGFYYVWDWPDGVVDHEWNDARKAWASACQNYLRYYSREGVDSESLLANWIKKGNGSRKLRGAYQKWDAVSDRPAPPTKAMWITKDYLRQIVFWAKQQKEPTLVWFSSRAVGEALQELGLTAHWKSNPQPGETCALSLAIHHKGRNYQAWANNFIAEPSPTGAVWEQLVGRTHRAGQKADTVYVTIAQDFWPQVKALETAKRQAKYIEETTGNHQKLCYCDWIRRPAVLKKRS